jgi:CHAD domain-containing protein
MSQEREVKLAAPPAFTLPDLGAVDGLTVVPRESQRFQTVYVDTSDLRVARWGCSLRHREGEGWTTKLPPTLVGSLLVRGEYAFEGEARRVPPAAADLLLAYTRGEDLRPVVRLRTVRRRIELGDAYGTPVGEVVDDEVSVMDGARVAARFREVEVEILPDVPEATAETVVAVLVEAGAEPTDGTPKYLRALGARVSSTPEVAVPELGTDASVEEVIRGAVATSVVRLFRHDAGVRLGGDAEDVHQARVATRRLRSDLRTFRDFIDPDWDVSLRGELGRLGGELGTVRDLDVQLERLRSRVAMLPEEDNAVGERLVDGLIRRREEVRAHLLEAMRSDRYTRLLDRLVVAARHPAVLPETAGAPAALALGQVMERPWKHLEDTIDAFPPDPNDADLHMARIRAKRVRYAAEAIAPVFGKRARTFARTATELQDVLGAHQDAVVAQMWLREAAATGGRRAFVAGEIATIERRAAEEARTAWPGIWKRLSRKRLRFWS